jgi:hypothetical protein
MNELPPSPEESDEVDALYRRASALDAGRPSESVRRAVLDHAAQLAANRAAGNVPARRDAVRWPKRQLWRRPAAFGTLAAAALAGLLFIPQFLTPRAPIMPASSSAPALSPTPTSPSGEVVQPQAPAAETPALRKDAPAADAAVEGAAQRVVVRAARAPVAEGRSRQTAQYVTGAQNASSALPAPMAASAPAAKRVPAAPSAQDEIQPAARSARNISVTSAAGLMDPAAQLRRAAEMGDVPALQALLDKKPAIEARDDAGRTALMLATLHGRNQAVEALLSAGADPNAADAHGTTPLQAALAGDQAAIAAALRRAGAR